MNTNMNRFPFALIALGVLFLLAILPDPWLPAMAREFLPREDLLAGWVVGVPVLVILGRRTLQTRRQQVVLAIGVGGTFLAGLTLFVL